MGWDGGVIMLSLDEEEGVGDWSGQDKACL